MGSGLVPAGVGAPGALSTTPDDGDDDSTSGWGPAFAWKNLMDFALYGALFVAADYLRDDMLKHPQAAEASTPVPTGQAQEDCPRAPSQNRSAE